MSNNKKIVVCFCEDCGCPASISDEDSKCGCGGTIIGQEFTEHELEEMRLERELYEVRERAKMTECDGSWDY